MNKLVTLLFLAMNILSGKTVWCQNIITIRPEEIQEVLVNPGMGFMTFQRFNGDSLNAEKTWTEGFPIDYQPFDGDLTNDHYPSTSLAYFRIYWKFMEPEKEKYNWTLIDQALATAKSRGQTLLLRIAPYGTGPERDVPGWYRDMMGVEDNLPEEKWQTDPEDPRYVQYFGGMIRAMGERYNGHPDLESVDMALVGAWGEGAGSPLLTDKTRKALVDCYLEAFPDTYLIMLLTDVATNEYGIS